MCSVSKSNLHIREVQILTSTAATIANQMCIKPGRCSKSGSTELHIQYKDVTRHHGVFDWRGVKGFTTWIRVLTLKNL
jgi:predicted nucleic acid-binding OB-fold protein